MPLAKELQKWVALLTLLIAATAYSQGSNANLYKENPTFSANKHFMIEAGGYFASQGRSQDIAIRYLAGNHYTVNNQNPSNGLVGLGGYLDGMDTSRFQVAYGINAFYLAPTVVEGEIIQEHDFTNLRYSYSIQQIPIYLAAKALLKNSSTKYNITFDVGAGLNVLRTSGYRETPLENYTIPDNGFSPHNTVTGTAMAGIGLRLNNVFSSAAVEFGYRFFYLGQGKLAINNDQILNPVKTGDTYANAVLVSLII